MAEVALRDYLNEIDTLIDHGSIEVAVQHCRHILQQYPKAVEVYRLLGKALLEREDERAAQDVFQRVLSVDPEDFVARVGLSIVHDRNNELEAAIWHMERAFAVAPSNALIQGELRRLYAHRDGEAPERIPLTRDALARMYAQGDLNTEAVADLRQLLREQPDRLDLTVQMAEVLWRDEQRVEASELTQQITAQLPYCLKANLIMGAILRDSGANGESDEPFQRAWAVDPENNFADHFFGGQGPLTKQLVMLDRLELQTVTDRLEIPALSESGEEVPVWLRGVSDLEPPLLPESELEHAPRLSTGLHMPDVATEIPDWLQGLAGPSTAEAEVPDWLTTLTGAAIAGAAVHALTERESAAPEESVPTSVSEEVPDWINQLGNTGKLTEPAPAADEDERPVWLAQLDEAPPAPFSETISVVEDTETPSWLAALTGAAIAGTAARELSERESEAPEAAAVEPEPEAPLGTIEHWEPQGMLTETETPVAEDEQPAWLAQFAETPPAPFSESISTAEDTQTPDWLAALAGAAVAGTAAHVLSEDETSEEPSIETAEEVPTRIDQLEATETLAEPLAPITEEERPDWLAQLTETPPAPFSETISTTEDAQTPDWLAVLTGAAVAGTTAHVLSERETPEELDIETEEEVPGWIDQLGATETLAEPLAPITEEERPDWLAQLAETPPPPFSETIPVAEDMQTPDWLVQLGGAAGEVSTEVEPEVPPQPSGLLVPEAPAQPEVPEEMPSADDALAFLAKLAAGKEDQLRAQAQQDADVRMAEIMGRKPVVPQPAEEQRKEPPVAGIVVAGAALVGVAVGAAKEKQPEAEIEAPAPPAVPEEMPSSDDALAFLAKLAAGKEDQLRAQAQQDADVRMAEIMGRKPVAPQAVVEAPSAVKPSESAMAAEPVVPEEMPSADDALAFLSNLAAGKEDQLRAQAQQDADVRMAEIMGRKPVAPKPAGEPPAAGVVAAGAVLVGAALGAAKVEEPEAEIEAAAAPIVPEAMPSADDALAFLAKLAAGKEDQLRLQAEQEADVRMAAIMGRSAPVAPALPIEPESAPAVEIETAAVEESTDWLAELTTPVAEPVSAGDLPDWLQQMRPTEESAAAEPASELPEWLRAMRPAEDSSAPGLTALFEEEVQTDLEATAPAAELPDWLRSMQLSESPDEAALEPIVAEEEPAEPAVTPVSELPDWLRAMRPSEPPVAEEIATEDAATFDGGSLLGVAAVVGVSAQLGGEESIEAEPTTEDLLAELAALEKVSAVEEVAPAQPRVILSHEWWAQSAEDTDEEPVQELPEPFVSLRARSIEKARATGRAGKYSSAPVGAQSQTGPLNMPTPLAVSPETEALIARVSGEPQDYAARLDLARTYWATGNREAAYTEYLELATAGEFAKEVMADLEAIVEIYDRSDWHRMLGDVYMKAGKSGPALAHYRLALRGL